MQLAQQFGITALLDRRFNIPFPLARREKPCCVQALMSEPDLLILE